MQDSLFNIVDPHIDFMGVEEALSEMAMFEEMAEAKTCHNPDH